MKFICFPVVLPLQDANDQWSFTIKHRLVNNAKQTQTEDTAIIYIGFMNVIFFSRNDFPLFFKDSMMRTGIRFLILI